MKFTNEELLEEIKKNPETSQEYLAHKFGVTQGAISKRCRRLGINIKEGKYSYKDYSLEDLLKKATISDCLHTVHISIGSDFADPLCEHLLNRFSASKDTYGILDIIRTERGILLLTDDLYLRNRLDSYSEES